KEVNMKVDQFKKLIKESIKEVLVEEGLLKEVISAVMLETQQVSAETTAEILKQAKLLQNNQKESFETSEEFKLETQKNQELGQKNMERMQELRNRMMDS
ncbi:MAG TPA: hypothetical protein DCM40_32450, partial [Maribacter sp.]|nr:hypothetical protein [Maribacter sp.]